MQTYTLMKYREDIFIQIIKNRQLRLKIALALNLSESGVLASAKRRSAALTKYPAPEMIKKELKITDTQLFEPLTSVFNG